MKSRIKAYEIALSSIATALAVVMVMMAVYLPNLNLTFYVISALAIMVPMSIGYFRATVLSYITTSVIVLILASLQTLPFVLFFGAYTIFAGFCINKKVNPIIAYPIKLIWVNIVFYILYFVTKLIIIDFEQLGYNLAYPLIALIASIIFLVYDVLLNRLYKYMQYYMAKYIKFHKPND